MNLLVLDTNVLVRLLERIGKLGDDARRMPDEAEREVGLLVLAITFWESLCSQVIDF